MKTLTAKQVNEKLMVDQVTLSKGTYTMRDEFYYRHGRSANDYVKLVRETFPNAEILESGEIWKPFRGGASTANSSHWFVKFKLKENDQ